jgi:hypothetical protein
VCVDEQGFASLVRKIEEARLHGHTHLFAGDFTDGLTDNDPWEQPSVGEVIIDWVEDPERIDPSTNQT